jgi:hypothetical protein
MGLGGPQHRAGRSFDIGAGEADGGVTEIDLGPAQPEQLATPGSRRRGQPQVGGEVRITFLDVGKPAEPDRVPVAAPQQAAPGAAMPRWPD